jgi:uncharacterized protein (DUF1015 family)
MVDIKPFKGLLYNDKFKDDLNSLVSPPYDIIPVKLKENLKKSNKYNIVNLILPEANEATDNIYMAAKSKLEEWVNKEIVVKDDKESLYIIEETFKLAGTTGKMLGLVALTKIEEYDSKIVLRHEKTLKKPREDRLNLLKSCRTNFGLIFLLFDDTNNIVSNIIENYTRKKPDADFIPIYDKSLHFRFWKISDSNDINKIKKAMQEEKPLIADGHHRYETSRTYREQLKSQGKGPEDYILTLYVSSSSKDIAIHPTHRVINFETKLTSDILLQKAKENFDITILEDSRLSEIPDRLAKYPEEGPKALAVYFKDRPIHLLTLKKPLKDIYDNKEIDIDYEILDVNILHKVLLERSIGEKIIDIKYVHTIGELENEVSSGDFQAGFILNPPSIKTVKRLSLQDQVMPQKSTYFYPKPCTGLVMYRFD